MIRPLALVPFLTLLCSVISVGSGQQIRTFSPKAYPAASFHVSRHDYPVGNYTVRIIQAKRAYEVSSPPPSVCRAWLEVREGDKVLRQAYFDDIDAVGGYYGLFLPKDQPLKDYFVVLKEGDYDGRLLLVGVDGSLTNIAGGEFFLTEDKRYLIGSHSSDYESLIVFDLLRRRMAIDGAAEKLPSVGDWYMDDTGYFFTEDAADADLANAQKKSVAIYRLDLEHLKVRADKVAPPQLATTRKKEIIPWRRSSDCTSVP